MHNKGCRAVAGYSPKKENISYGKQKHTHINYRVKWDKVGKTRLQWDNNCPTTRLHTKMTLRGLAISSIVASYQYTCAI